MSQIAEEHRGRGVAGVEGSLRELALESIKRKRDFVTHLIAYVLVNSFLWVVWAVVSWAIGTWVFPWAIIPLAGWSIGLGMHAWHSYGRSEITAADIEREMRRLQGA